MSPAVPCDGKVLPKPYKPPPYEQDDTESDKNSDKEKEDGHGPFSSAGRLSIFGNDAQCLFLEQQHSGSGPLPTNAHQEAGEGDNHHPRSESQGPHSGNSSSGSASTLMADTPLPADGVTRAAGMRSRFDPAAASEAQQLLLRASSLSSSSSPSSSSHRPLRSVPSFGASSSTRRQRQQGPPLAGIVLPPPRRR